MPRAVGDDVAFAGVELERGSRDRDLWLAIVREGRDHGDRKHTTDHGEGNQSRDVDQIVQKELDGDEEEDRAERVLQVSEPLEEARESTEETPQARDCKNVRRVDDQRILRDGEDRGNRVQREDYVRQLDHEQGQEQEGRAPPAFVAHEEAAAFESGDARNEAEKHARYPAVRRVADLRVSADHAEGRREEHDSQHVLEPVKAA
jgi:hypothetical protein